jgi:hypothetical protein
MGVREIVNRIQLNPVVDSSWASAPLFSVPGLPLTALGDPGTSAIAS